MKSDFSATLVFACIVLVLLRIHAAVAAEEGSSCPGRLSGTCLPIIKCLPAINALRKNGRHDFERCGFDDQLEIVCCPEEDEPDRTTTTTTTTTTTSKTILRNPSVRRSLQACEVFADIVGPWVTYQILGGVGAKLGEFPHMAAIGFKPDDEDELSWNCGASLISDRYALTAAHCFIKRDGRKPVKVRMGTVNITGDYSVSPIDYDIANVTMHPLYDRKTKHNDIALIKLKGTVEFSKYVAPACLYQKHDNPAGLVATGWGTTEPAGETSEILQKVSLDPVSVEICNINHTSLLLGKPISATQICAKSPDGRKDTCQGDSGGPLQVQIMRGSSIYSIVGITSYGRSCGGTVPSVYTRVYSFLDWIEEIVWP